MAIHNKILENRVEHMEFSAKLAGAEIKGSGGLKNQSSSPKENNLISNLRKAKESELQNEAKTKKNAKFSDGVGYRVI